MTNLLTVGSKPGIFLMTTPSFLNKGIVIQKADKGNTVVILDKCSSISVIEEILNDNFKFSKLAIPAGKEINHIVNLEKRITSELKLLKDKEIID